MGPKRVPPSFSDFDDSEEDTLVEASGPTAAGPTTSLTEPPLLADDDEEDATEVMVRRRPAAVQIGKRARPLMGAPREAVNRVAAPLADDEEELETARLPSLASLREDPLLSEEGPPPRPLDSLPAATLPRVSLEDDATLSRPKVQKMTFPREAEAGAAASPPPEGTGAHGTLVIDVPPEATVYVDGKAQGTGAVRLEAVDRFARLHVRVHQPGFEPWTGVVSLAGQATARVSPALKRR